MKYAGIEVPKVTTINQPVRVAIFLASIMLLCPSGAPERTQLGNLPVSERRCDRSTLRCAFPADVSMTSGHVADLGVYLFPRRVGRPCGCALAHLGSGRALRTEVTTSRIA
jgi:hypothetical protein